MHKVTFKSISSGDLTVSAAYGDNLLETARNAGIPIDAPCSGAGTCGKCKVQLVEGSLNSEMNRHIKESEYSQGYRLACCSTVSADAVILVPKGTSAYLDNMRIADLSSEKEINVFTQINKDLTYAGINFKNSFEIVRVEMSEPNNDDTMPDTERLTRALKSQTGLDKVTISYTALKKLPDTLRNSNFGISCVLSQEDGEAYVHNVCSEANPQVYGIAVDIGTTSVTAMIIDMLKGDIIAKASAGNAQIRFGADVIHRIVEQQREDGIKRLKNAIVEETINPLIARMCESSGINSSDIYRISIASNTTMNHLLTGVNTNYLRMEPFIPVFFEMDSLRTADLDIKIDPHAKVLIAPNVGSYVGGDITAGTLASMIWSKPGFSLFVDLGTNGEIVFGNSDFLMSCACSAGPAFEGGDISCGMRATDGAIEAVTIDAQTHEPNLSVIGNTKPVGICGSGIIDAVAELYRTGIIDSKGKFVVEGPRVKRDKYGIGSYILSFPEDNESGNLELNEVDIDNFVRAKGAVYSAIKVMLESLGFDTDIIENVYIAGGIGSGINIESAIRIGMLPDIPRGKYHYIGNSALAGAYALLMSSDAEQKIHEIARNMTYIELSTDSRYMDEFIAACFIPHTNR